MNNSLRWTLLFSLLFLFFVQAAGVLVESIYILDLMNTSLDEKVAGLLFFFTPVILLAFGKRAPRSLVWGAFIFLFIGRGLIPTLDTTGRLLAAGCATGAALLLLPIFLSGALRAGAAGDPLIPAQGLALAVGLSTLLRTVNFTLDYSLEPVGAWLGWVLGVLLGILLFITLGHPEEKKGIAQQAPKSVQKSSLIGAALGVVSVLVLCYFIFFSPGVLSRWTQGNYRGNYRFIIVTVSGLSLGWVLIMLWKPDLLKRISPRLLLTWNVLFTLTLTGFLLSHGITFPPTPDSPAVVVSGPAWYHGLLLAFMILLFPVIFFDFMHFVDALAQAQPSPRKLAPGFVLGALFLVLLVLINIFSNVWGYVEPISTPFRNKFWLPYLLITSVVTLLIAFRKPQPLEKTSLVSGSIVMPTIILLAIFLGTMVAAQLTDRDLITEPSKTSLRLMTYNIQAANDDSAQRSYARQLALIRQVNPDILALQESDTARISLNNNDYVRYFANKLGYFSYYGPETVTGTFGTALLSKFPLENPNTFFTFSDQDEIGTAQAEIVVGGRRFTIFNVHPDGSDQAMLAFARELLARAVTGNIIALGDYNLREDEEAYKLVASALKSAWLDAYPTGIDANGLDMSGRKRIDHIFLSPNLTVSNPVYLLAPESATDHPAHWTDISW